jgi:hypothetical protein
LYFFRAVKVENRKVDRAKRRLGLVTLKEQLVLVVLQRSVCDLVQSGNYLKVFP